MDLLRQEFGGPKKSFAASWEVAEAIETKKRRSKVKRRPKSSGKEVLEAFSISQPFRPPKPTATGNAEDKGECSKTRRKLKVQHFPAATTYKQLSISDRRLGNEAVKQILDRGKTHNGLLSRACSSIDASEPRTRIINKKHEKLRNRDPMPGLDLPREIKLHSSFSQLSEFKWRKEWHERLLKTTKSSLNLELPKHVKIYQKRKRAEQKKLLEGIHPVFS